LGVNPIYKLNPNLDTTRIGIGYTKIPQQSATAAAPRIHWIEKYPRYPRGWTPKVMYNIYKKREI